MSPNNFRAGTVNGPPPAGAAGELTGATRPWAFGDTEPWNVTRTLTNAVLRRAGTGDPDGPLRIAVEDVEVSETETRTQAAVALLVDTSFSMVMENRWLPMKRTALALHHLVSTRFRSDALQIIAFGRYARTVTAAELTGLEGVYEQGTNLHHALALARPAPAPPPQCPAGGAVVTDGEPTAHLEDYNGERRRFPAFFDYPPHPRTIAHTVRGFDDVARLGAQDDLPARQRRRPGPLHRPDRAAGGGPGGGARSRRSGRGRGRRLPALPAAPALSYCGSSSNRWTCASALDADTAPQREAADRDLRRSWRALGGRRRGRSRPSPRRREPRR
jgi:hypothetical protein